VREEWRRLCLLRDSLFIFSVRFCAHIVFLHFFRNSDLTNRSTSDRIAEVAFDDTVRCVFHDSGLKARPFFHHQKERGKWIFNPPKLHPLLLCLLNGLLFLPARSYSTGPPHSPMYITPPYRHGQIGAVKALPPESPSSSSLPPGPSPASS
jgi:hypothetical protein